MGCERGLGVSRLLGVAGALTFVATGCYIPSTPSDTGVFDSATEEPVDSPYGGDGGGNGGDVGTAGTDTDTDSGVPVVEVAPTIIDATCNVQDDNLLRYDCTVTTDVDATVWVEFEGKPGVRSSSVSEGTTHAVTIWGLHSDTSYTWSVSAENDHGADAFVGTSVTTGIPDVVIDLFASALEVSAPQTEYILVNAPCATGHYTTILDTDGNVVWYDDAAADSRIVTGLQFTQDGTVFTVYDDERFIERALDGRVIRDWTEKDIGAFLHHDVHIRDGILWGLSITPMTLGGQPYIIDSVHGYDADGNRVHEWSMDEVLDPRGYDWHGDSAYWGDNYPGHCDPFHVNSFDIDDNGDWILSMKDLDEVLKVYGPDSPAAGQLAWNFRADGTGSLKYAAGDGVVPFFAGQHHVTQTDETTLLMFDNLGILGSSRALVFELDEDALTAAPIQQFSMEDTCELQGSAYWVGDHMLATCGPDHWMREFDASGNTVWGLALSCGQQSKIPTYRGIPVTLDP